MIFTDCYFPYQDLEELRDELEDDEYEEVRADTLEQLKVKDWLALLMFW